MTTTSYFSRLAPATKFQSASSVASSISKYNALGTIQPLILYVHGV